MKRLSFYTIFFYLQAAIGVSMLATCESDHPRLHAYPNPELDALRKRGVKYRLTQCPGYYKPDTVFATPDGVYSAEKGFTRVWTFYDSLNFIQKIFISDDITSNAIFRYHFRDALHLVQERIFIDDRDWNIDRKAITPVDTSIMILEYDRTGRIVREIDSTRSRYTAFLYNDTGTLKARTQCANKDDFWLRRHSYYYDVNGDLTKVVEQDHLDSMTITYYYSQGLLDSLANSDMGTVCYYQHIFY